MQQNILLDNGSILKVQKVRQRKIYSCVACHGKKLKCTKERPSCQRCKKMQIDCKYYINERISRKNRSKDQKVVPKELQIPNEIANVPEKPQETPKVKTRKYIEKSSKLQLFNKIIDNIPAKSQSDLLVSVYQEKVHFFFPFIDLELFNAEYNEFWDLYLAHKLRGSTNWDVIFDHKLEFFLTYYIMLVASFLNGDSNFYSDIDYLVDRIDDVKDAKDNETFISLNEVISSIFQYINLPKRSRDYPLSFLTLFTLYQSFIPIPSIIEIATLVRMGQLFKLDKDTETRNSNIKRLLWYQIVFLDARFSFVNHTIPMITMDDFDTLPPNEWDSNGILDPSIATMNMEFRFGCLLNQVCRKEFDTLRDKVIELSNKCAESIYNLNTWLLSIKNSKILSALPKSGSFKLHHILPLNKVSKLIHMAVSNFELIPDKVLFFAFSKMTKWSAHTFVMNTNLPDYPVYYNYSNYNIDTNNYHIILYHMMKKFVLMNHNFADLVGLKWSVESHWYIEAILLLVYNLVNGLKGFVENMKQRPFEGEESKKIVKYLKNSLDFNYLNLLVEIMKRNLRRKVPKLSFWNKAVYLVHEILKFTKLYAIRFSDVLSNTSYDEMTIEDQLDQFVIKHDLNCTNIEKITFIEPFDSNCSAFEEKEVLPQQPPEKEAGTTSCADITSIAPIPDNVKLRVFDSPLDNPETAEEDEQLNDGGLFASSYTDALSEVYSYSIGNTYFQIYKSSTLQKLLEVFKEFEAEKNGDMETSNEFVECIIVELLKVLEQM